MTAPDPTLVTAMESRKPLDEEIDVYGLTHPGKVRRINQDHYLLCSLHRRVVVHGTSLPTLEDLPPENERLAFLAMVADGVGGGAKGEEASRLAVSQVAQYVTYTMRCYYTADAAEESFIDSLQEAAVQCHAAVLRRAQQDPDRQGMATTLTLWLGVWPWNYVLQVGDSRYYVFRDQRLHQVTRDQTVAQELIDRGVLSRSQAVNTRWASVLSSAIGGQQTAPVAMRMPADLRNTHLMCSDGLVKHVSDERIAERLGAMTSAKQVCEDLLQDALDGGGSDNITIVVGRVIRPQESVPTKPPPPIPDL